MITLFLERKQMMGYGALLLVAASCFCWWLHQEVPTKPAAVSPVDVAVTTTKETVRQPVTSYPVDREDFFVESRLARDRINSQKIALDQQIANNLASSEEIRNLSQRDLMELSDRMGAETELERLIMARGYPEVLAVIQDKSATVIIQARVLLPEEVDKIVELVSRCADRAPASITVIPRP